MTPCAPAGRRDRRSRPLPDFSEVMGQENVKRALEIAAAGGHILLVGSPGAGKVHAGPAAAVHPAGHDRRRSPADHGDLVRGGA